MSKRQTKVMLGGVVLVSWALVACTAGVGSPVDIGQAYGDKPGSFGTADNPNSSNGGNSAGSGAGAGRGTSDGEDERSGDGKGQGSSGECPPCDGTITCDVTVGGQTQKATLPLQTKNGACAATITGGDVVLACGGQITQNGQSIGTWKNCSRSATPGTPTEDAPAPPVDAGTRG